MDFKCDLIKDILPLYVDDLCSVYTKSIVDEHVLKCDSCKQLLKELNQKLYISENIKSERKKLNPFVKIKRVNRTKIVFCVLCSIVIISAVYTKLFLLGFTASTSHITVRNIEMLNDDFTFEIEMSANSGLNFIKQVFISPYMDSISEYGLGHVYLQVNTAITYPWDDSIFKTIVGFDQEALNNDRITAIYLIGKNQTDIKLVWERD